MMTTVATRTGERRPGRMRPPPRVFAVPYVSPMSVPYFARTSESVPDGRVEPEHVPLELLPERSQLLAVEEEVEERREEGGGGEEEELEPASEEREVELLRRERRRRSTRRGRGRPRPW